jgi:hypothetical protein
MAGNFWTHTVHFLGYIIILLQGGGRYHPHTSSSKAQQQGGRSPALSLVSGSGRASRRGSSRRSPLASPGAGGGGGGGHYPPDLVGISEPGVKPTQDNSDRWGYTVKIGYRFSRPQPGCHKPNSPSPGINGYRFSPPQPGCHKTNSPWTGIFKLFPARESLVSDIPAGDRKNITFFYSVHYIYVQATLPIGWLSFEIIKKSPKELC